MDILIIRLPLDADCCRTRGGLGAAIRVPPRKTIMIVRMKTFLTIMITAVLTWIAAGLFHGLRTGAERLWMVSALKAPGRMAIGDIQQDMHAGRYDLARAKVDAFMRIWQRFSSGTDSCHGAGIGDIMVTFSKIQDDTNVENAGANASQPIHSETNSASSSASAPR